MKAAAAISVKVVENRKPNFSTGIITINQKRRHLP